MLKSEVFNRPYVRDITKTCECTCSVTCNHNVTELRPDRNPGIITNADRIRAMSDDDMADTMCRNPIFTVCDAVCKGDCKAVDTLNDTKDAICKRTILEWLKQPAEED